MNEAGSENEGETRETPAETESLIQRWGAWLWAPFVAAAPGWTSYVLAHSDAHGLLRKNLDPAPSMALLHMLGGALLVVGLWAWLGPRLAPGQSRPRAWLEAVLATRLLVLGPIVLTLVHDPAGFADVGRMILILLGGLVVALSLRRWPALPAGGLARVRRMLGGDRWPVLVLFVGVGMVAMLLLRLAFWRHHGFETRAFDLGIYDNLVWNTAHGNFLVCTLIKGGVHTAAHYDPILALVALPYLAFPRAESLVVIQALWVLSGAIPAYLIAMRRLDDRLAATILALGFALYPSLHGVIMFDFHSLALLAAPGLWMIDCLDEDRPIGYWIAFGLALLVREDASLFLAGVGAYAFLATEHRRRAALTIGFALAYLAFVKFAIMPDSDLLMRNSDTNYTYANRYRRLIPEGGTASDGIATLLTNPSFVLGHVLTTTKVLAALAFVVPLGLFPLAGGRRMLLAVYGIAFMFLASHKSIFYPLFHYSTVLYPALFAATPEGIARVRAWLVQRGESEAKARASVLGYLATCLVLGSLSMGALVEVPIFSLGRELVRDYDSEKREYYAWFREQIAQIPGDASVSASNRTAPHLSNRAELYIIQQRVEADWIVVDLDDVTGKEGAWLRGLISEGRYVEVLKRGRELWILRRVDEL